MLLLALVIAVWPCSNGLGRFACKVHRPEWHTYRQVFERALASDDTSSHSELADALKRRTSNVSDVLSCNVGVIAGYHLLARRVEGDDRRAQFLRYRLLQLALIFIFTLRNANRIPQPEGDVWFTSERSIIPWIMHLRSSVAEISMLQARQQRRPVSPTYRDSNLRIAVVSICAYPEDGPLALPRITPKNRELYADRHGYSLRVHMEPPVIGAHGLGIQHAKLATVMAYLQSGDFDWVAWFDCDSILMNVNKTLDSIIHQYAQIPEELPIVPCGAPEDVLGVFMDSWAQPDDELLVKVTRDSEGGLEASAIQFGLAHGGLRSQGTEMWLQFEGGEELVAQVQQVAGKLLLKWENGAVWERRDADCREACSTGENCGRLDDDVDLLITEEGWGLSSANWLIRRSDWSIDFLHRALTVAHAEFQMFGDQDAIILCLMNAQALDAFQSCGGCRDDPLDRHAVIVPQHELNSYDHLNALTMDVDGFSDGDLLVTFPQCNHADECNPLFELAFDYSKAVANGAAGGEENAPGDGAWWRRQPLAEPRWDGYESYSGRALRLFGPREAVRAAWENQLG